jgi:hypothetical protein
MTDKPVPPEINWLTLPLLHDWDPANNREWWAAAQVLIEVMPYRFLPENIDNLIGMDEP